MPSSSLPARPNLEQLRKQAKDLLEAYRAGDPTALLRFRESLPKLAGSSDDQLEEMSLPLRDAQRVVAAEYGFDSWAQLKDHVSAGTDSNLIEVVIDRLRSRPTSRTPNSHIKVVVLRAKQLNRYLPIWIGPAEADSIAVKLEGQQISRPLTHDLMDLVIGDLGAKIAKVVVSDLREETFFAKVVLQRSGTSLERDSRPSDAIALAVRNNAPIFVTEDVLERAGIDFDARTGLPEIDFDYSSLSIEDMGRMFSDEVQAVLVQAGLQALRRRHEEAEPNDLMLALIDLPQCVGVRMLVGLGADLQAIRSRLEPPHMKEDPASDATPQMSEASQNVLRLAKSEAAKIFDMLVETEHLMLGLAMSSDAQTSQIFTECGIDIERARAAVLRESKQWDVSSPDSH